MIVTFSMSISPWKMFEPGSKASACSIQHVPDFKEKSEFLNRDVAMDETWNGSSLGLPTPKVF